MVFPETCIYCINTFCLFISIISFSFAPYNEFYRVTVQKMSRLVWNHGAARAAGGDFCLFSHRSDSKQVLSMVVGSLRKFQGSQSSSQMP